MILPTRVSSIQEPRPIDEVRPGDLSPPDPSPLPIVAGTISPQIPLIRSTTSLTPLVCDQRAISRLLETLLERSGLTIPALAERMGVTTNSIRQYFVGRRSKPSLIWFVKFVELCGGKIQIEFPTRR